MLDLLYRPSLAVPFFILLSYFIYVSFIRRPTKLPDLPYLNVRPGEWFPRILSRWRTTRDFKSAMMLAYNEYSKKDLSCIMSFLGSPEYILLPSSLASFIIEQSDQVLRSDLVHMEDLQTDRTMPDPMLVRNPTHHHVITRDLTSKVGNLVPDIIDEIVQDLEEQWGTNTEEWMEICVFDSMKRCIGRTSNRVFVGAPLCRNKEYLDAGIAFAQDVPLGSNLIRLFPKILQPLAGQIITIPNKLHTRTFFKHLVPEVQKRLNEYDRKQNDPESKSAEPERNDYLQWTINYAKKSHSPAECDARTIAGRILMLNFAAVHTSTISLTHTLYDVASCDQSYVAELRDEISTILSSSSPTNTNTKWTKTALSQMLKLDSTLRESLRLNSFVTIGLQRLVVSPTGLTTPQGLHCPQGSVITVPGYPLHQDPEIWGPDAKEFKPFRFSEQRDPTASDSKEDHVRKARLAFATTTNEFIAFGHGRHACPGRFFAANELKLMFAWIVLNYEIEPLPTRPKNKWFGVVRIPDPTAKIRVRRRKGTV